MRAIDSYTDSQLEVLELKGMVPSRPKPTEVEAAQAIIKHAQRKCQQEVLGAYALLGPMTDEQLESLPLFVKYGPTTVSKRRTELYQKGEVINTGRKIKNSRGRSMIVWDLNREVMHED